LTAAHDALALIEGNPEFDVAREQMRTGVASMDWQDVFWAAVDGYPYEGFVTDDPLHGPRFTFTDGDGIVHTTTDWEELQVDFIPEDVC